MGGSMYRRPIVAASVALVIFLTIAVAPAFAFTRSGYEARVLELVNQARTSRGLAPVHVVSSLDEAAIAHSRDMLSRDYFSHVSPGGSTVSSRTRAAGYSVSGYTRWSVGEIIAWGSGTRGTPEAIFKAWMGSSTHRAIILTAKWRDVGIGCAQGTFRGLDGVVMYTIDFGRRVR